VVQTRLEVPGGCNSFGGKQAGGVALWGWHGCGLAVAVAGFLLRIIADAFDLPPQCLGIEKDLNRSTAAEMADAAFLQAIVPTARLLAEYLTRDGNNKKLDGMIWNLFYRCGFRGDVMEEAQIQALLLQNGVLTVAEVRRMRDCHRFSFGLRASGFGLRLFLRLFHSQYDS